MSTFIDWNQIVDWDKKYILRTSSTLNEYQSIPIERTEGDYLITPDGQRILDFFNQLFCVNAGQSNPEINEKIKEALDRYGFLWDMYTSDYKARAAKMLLEDILGTEDWAGKVRFTNTGSDANEAALMIARLYKNKPLVVTREYAFHGHTKGAGGLTRIRSMKSGLVNPQTGEVRAIPGSTPGDTIMAPAPNCANCSLGHAYPSCKSEDGTLACVKYTKRLIENTGVEQISALVTEIAQGAGIVHAPNEYIPQIYQLTREMDLIWIVDEVLTGFGRMGTWFGYQGYADVRPDIMTLAKGISSSAIPAGAVIVSKEIADFMDDYRWQTVSTFSGHPIAMASVCANLEYMLKHNLPQKAKEAGEYFGERLQEIKKKHPSVGKVAGKGMLWLVELVKNNQTSQKAIEIDRNYHGGEDAQTFPTTIIASKALEKGVMLSGNMPNTLRIGASLNVSVEDMDKALEALDYALTYLDELYRL